MSEKITSREVALQALNVTEVRQALEQKGIKLQKESLFTVSDDGTAKVDIDGDGIYDKNITGLVTKSGAINTKAKEIKVEDENVSTETVKKMNDTIAQLKADIAKYTEKASAKFDENAVKASAERYYNQLLATYTKTANDTNAKLAAKRAEYNTEMTSKELKAHRKEVERLENEAKYNKKQLDKFTAAKEEFIATSVKSEKSKFNAEMHNNEKQLEKTKTKLANYQTAYNDFLDKNGYTTQEARANVKKGTLEKKGEALKEAQGKNAVIEAAVRNFVKGNANLSQNLGDDYRVEIQGSNVLIKANGGDGDDRADYVMTGIYDEKSGEISTDKATIRFQTPNDSTSNVTAKVLKYKADLQKFNAMNADINTDKSSKAYKELERSLDATRAALRAMNVTAEELQK